MGVERIRRAPAKGHERRNPPEATIDGRPARFARASHEVIAGMQQSAGNRTVCDLLSVGQAKLEVGAAGDHFEREADDVARRVVTMIQGGGRELGPAEASPSEAGPAVSRVAEVGAKGGPISESTEAEINSARGSGKPLDGSIRSTMEDAIGADFGGVRIHTGPQAADLSQRVQAKAFTVGNDIFFRNGEPNYASTSGQELLAHELVHTVQQGGSPAVARAVDSPISVQRKLVDVSGEKVEVADDDEEIEAKDIIETLKSTYGVDVSSTKGVEAIKDQYTNVPEDVLDSLTTRRWRMIELRAVLETMKHYAQILGAERENSARKGSAQEVTVVGKVTQAINTNTSAGKLDTTTLGEYFKANKTMNLFKAQEGKTSDFPGDEGKQLVGTFVHEMAHGLLAYAYDKFVQESGGYWTNQNTKSGRDGAEAPITKYGATNAREDLCETAMFYFVEPDKLKNGRGAAAGTPGNPAPLRYAFMEKITNEWLPPPPPPVAPEPVTRDETTKPGEKLKPKKKPWWKFWKK